MAIFYDEYINEADRQLKNDRKSPLNSNESIKGRTAEPEWGKKNLRFFVTNAIKDKDNRLKSNKYNITNRTTADGQIKRLIKSGVSKDEINSIVKNGRSAAAEDKAELEDIKRERREEKGIKPSIHDKINERSRKSIKEACEYILSVIDESYDYDDEY